ncbi:hypothetical protein [Dongia sp.]|uniref:hypothetical protein n=1 Tax=Dongia sp. TaxID=1977262 RepID=UPI003752E158
MSRLHFIFPVSMILAGLALSGLSASELQAQNAAHQIDHDTLSRLAWVRAGVKACRDDSPTMAGHLVEAYEGWVAKTPVMETLIKQIDDPADAALTAETRGQYGESFKQVAQIFEWKRVNEPEDFAELCDKLTKDLAGFRDDNTAE